MLVQHKEIRRGKPFSLDTEHLSEWVNVVEWMGASGTGRGAHVSKCAHVSVRLKSVQMCQNETKLSELQQHISFSIVVLCLCCDSNFTSSLIQLQQFLPTPPTGSCPSGSIADKSLSLAWWRLPCLSVYFQAWGPALRQAGRQAGGVVEGRGVDACVREALSHIPPAAGSKPGLRRGVRLFLTTSQVPALIWELFISCQKTAFPCNCKRRKGVEGEQKGLGGRTVWLQNKSRAWYSKPWT